MMLDFAFDPTLIRLGPLAIGWHGVFSMLAILVAVQVGLARATAKGLDDERLPTVVVWGILGGLAGARLFHVADHLDVYLANPLAIFAVWQGGMAAYGGFLGGIGSGWLAARRVGLPTWQLLDAAAPALLLGQAIGRLGCLANGDAWGAPCGGCAVCLCIAYHHPDAALPAALHGVPTHAYPAYEIVAVLALLAAVWWARDRLQRPGALFLAVALGYAAIRFGLSFLRQEPLMLWGLQEAQVVALATATLAAALLWPIIRSRPQPQALSVSAAER
jgi:phosphatidylglycerol:prolipoprotein diacylglycerol transferase